MKKPYVAVLSAVCAAVLAGYSSPEVNPRTDAGPPATAESTASLPDATGGDTQLDAPTPTDGGGDVTIANALCDAMDAAMVEAQLSEITTAPVAGPLTATPWPGYETTPGEARYVAFCSLTTQGEQTFTIPGCVSDGFEVHASLQDFTFGPLPQIYPADNGPDVEVTHQSAAEYMAWEKANAEQYSSDTIPWEYLPDGIWQPDLAIYVHLIEQNDQILGLGVGGGGAGLAGEGCQGVRDMHIAMAERIVGVADRIASG
ncbi:MAG: hypothetical protein M3Q22_06880 [Actinomycetota bacterium]|nr:hypothetical protein [Actinomycetota bacterium]